MNLITANGEIPVYKMKYSGKEFAFYLSLVGAPASVSCFEEVIALGAKKFVFFGCCGVLDDNIVGHNLIVSSGAIRDEGVVILIPPGKSGQQTLFTEKPFTL